ncbi:hypothetical protein QYE76_026761 [Lolium multiflorum]|uniref:Transposase (putative) gypsy type domain-containing protein n=1 Tax=Lolium multiflorum TaxID=4521 RepID=A0AAD8VVX4_LOLMU|nr:hypothetical protein QYE76_026761 [Lolium multiflorum]
MVAKVLEAEQKKGSKARNREGEKGRWWPCEVTDSELRAFEKEGLIAPDTWSFQKDSSTPKPEPDEHVFTMAWVECGLSLPPSEFFLSVLNTYGLQPHNICPNSYFLLSNFVTLCEGHLGIRPDVRLWQFFYRVKKETKDKIMVNCGSMTFMLRPQRMFPTLASHESLNTLAEDGFKNVFRVPASAEGVEEDPEDGGEEEEQASKKAAPHAAKRPRAKVSGSEAGSSGEASAKKAKTKPPPCLDSKKAERERASSSLATASSELENLRSTYKYLETKLTEAEDKREFAEKQLAEKKSEFIRENADLVAKRRVDSDTLKKLQIEVQGLRNYMTTAEKGWDLLNADVMEPLGYDEDRRNMLPRDDLIKLAGDDCKDLISTCRKICHNLAIKESRTCDVRGLIHRMDALPELVVDLQASSARGTAQMSLAMCLARAPGLDIDLTTAGVPPDCDADALLDACSGYDTRIARRIRHDEFYDKVVLPADEALEAELDKEREAEARPVGSGDSGQFTWTSSKEAEKDKSKGGATSPTEEAEDSDEDVVSSLAKEAEKEQAHAEDEARSSPTKKK